MPSWRRIFTSREAFIESKAGQCTPSETQDFISAMVERARRDWPMPEPPPYPGVDDEGEAEPDE